MPAPTAPKTASETAPVVEPKPEDKIADLVADVRKDVEPKTDAFAAIEALVKGQAAAFKTAIELGEVEAHECATQFESKARELAESTLNGVEAHWAKLRDEEHGTTAGAGAGAETGGVAAVEREQPHGLRSPMAPAASLADRSAAHNQHVVDAASEAGMEPDLAHQMSTHGSNV